MPIGGSRAGVTGAATPLFQISKIKESNKTKKNIETILLKREKRERVACLASFYVNTR